MCQGDPRGWAAIAAAVVVVLAGCATAPPTPTSSTLDFPSPLTGPGQPEIGSEAERRINEGWIALTTGDLDTARQRAAQAGSNPAARLLVLQADVVGKDHAATDRLEELAADQRNYAAAWLTLSAAAEGAGNRPLAWSSAVTGNELWTAERWRQRVEALHEAWIEEPIETAGRLLAEGRLEEALETLAPALDVDPQNPDGRVLEARILVARGEPDRAEATLAGLPRDDDVVLAAAEIAEARGDSRAALRMYLSLPDNPEAVRAGIAIAETEEDWQTAMQLYRALPDGDAATAEGLRRAKLRWRLSVLPDYAREALHAEALDRRQFAVVLVSLAPRLETLPGGEVPLLSDIMHLTGQREILTVVRLGLLDADSMEHLFYPHREIDVAEAREAIDGLASLLELGPPKWCAFDPPPCRDLGQPVSGTDVTSVVIEMMSGEVE